MSDNLNYTNPPSGSVVRFRDDGTALHQKVDDQGQSAGDFFPSPYYQRCYADAWQWDSLRTDSEGNLSVRGAVTTDEGSFRDDFSGSGLTTSISGNITTDGTDIITGSNFLTNGVIKFGHYIKVDSHAETVLARVVRVLSETQLQIDQAYGGANTTAAGSVQNYKTNTGSGGSFSVSSGNLTIASGTTTTSQTYILREEDYPPLIAVWAASVSQRIANQTGYLGLQDAASSPGDGAWFVFDGTTNTTVKCRSAFSSAAADQEETTVTLPNGGTTAGTHLYGIELRQGQVVFTIDNVPMASHRLHIPDPYQVLYQWAGWINGGSAPASSSNIVLDAIGVNNFDVLQPSQITAIPIADADAAQIGETLCERVSNTDGAATNLTVFGATTSARNCINYIVVYNDSTTNGFIDFLDGSSPGTILLTLPLPAKGGAIFQPSRPLRQPTLNNAFRFDVSAALTTVYISVGGYKSKV